MLRTFAAVLIAASLVTAPAFAQGNAPAAPAHARGRKVTTAAPVAKSAIHKSAIHKVAKVKKHRGHKAKMAKHIKHVKHVRHAHHMKKSIKSVSAGAAAPRSLGTPATRSN